LGWLQPRFHLRGPAMVQAEELERSGLRDTVNVASDFLHALRGDDGGEVGRRQFAEEAAIPAGWCLARTRNPIQGQLLRVLLVWSRAACGVMPRSAMLFSAGCCGAAAARVNSACGCTSPRAL